MDILGFLRSQSESTWNLLHATLMYFQLLPNFSTFMNLENGYIHIAKIREFGILIMKSNRCKR